MITLRPATKDDIPLLKYWDEQPHVIASGVDDWDWEQVLGMNPAHWWNFIAEHAGTAIGFVQIIDPALEETHYWGDVPQNLRAIDIWIGEAAYLGKGYGTNMMSLALDFCFATPEVTKVIIDPLVRNKNALRFYQRLGYEFVENRWFEDDYCAVHEISRQRWMEQRKTLQP